MLSASLFSLGRHCDARTLRRLPAPFGVGIAVLALLASVLPGCTTPQRCEALGRCGGELVPAGKTQETWVATGATTCIDEIQPPVIPVSISLQPAQQAGKKATGNQTADWCSTLLIKPDGSLSFAPFYTSLVLPMKQAELQFRADGTYFGHFITEEAQHIAFPAACRVAQGVDFSCAELGRHVNDAIRSESNVKNMRCYDDGEDGCMCDFLLQLFTGVQGAYGAQDGVIGFYDSQSSHLPPTPADYCASADTFELTGHDGQELFNKLGLRTITFHHTSCTDGLQDADEDGVDCVDPKKRAMGMLGPDACPNDCTATCSDGVQNHGETGVDCGGPCADFCACFNGVQDPWEEGPDCGGPCSLACTCIDGVKDGHEEGVDCGADCVLRFADGMGKTKDCPK